MRWTDLRVGYRCNQACRFCDLAPLVASANTGKADPDASAVSAALAAIPHREGLILAGGEVTLRPDLPALVEAAKGAGFRRIALQTNGSVLAAAGAAPHLRKLGLTDLAVALHSPEAAVHDWLTSTPGAFRRATTAVRQARASGLTVRIHAVVTRTTTPQAAALVELAARLGATAIRFVMCREEGAAKPEARMLAPRLSLAAEAVTTALERARLLGIELETVGLPLCMNAELRPVAADRLDAPSPERAFAGAEEAPHSHRHTDTCVSCPLRSACRGVESAYLERWGDDELAPPSGRPPLVGLLRLELGVGFSSRTLRQRLVQGQARGVTRVVLDGPGDHPDRGALVRECERLGLEVGGDPTPHTSAQPR